MSEGEASGEMEAIQIRLDLRAKFMVKGFVSAALSRNWERHNCRVNKSVV